MSEPVPTLTVLSSNLGHWRRSERGREAARHGLDAGLASEVDGDIARLRECRFPAGREHPMIGEQVRDHDGGRVVSARRAAVHGMLCDLAPNIDHHSGHRTRCPLVATHQRPR